MTREHAPRPCSTAWPSINRQTYEELGDPETHARIAQYEMAFRMQRACRSSPTLRRAAVDLGPYGPEAKKPGTFAYNCLMARRLAERGVRFTQVYQRGWDLHGDLQSSLNSCAAPPTAPATR